MHSINNTVAKLKSAFAPQALVSLAIYGEAPDVLDYLWQEPKTFYSFVKEFPGNMPFENQLVPLWEVNGDKIIALIDDGTERVIEYYYEDSTEEFKVISIGVEAAIKHSLEWLYFEAEAEDEAIISLATQLGIHNPNKFLNELQKKVT